MRRKSILFAILLVVLLVGGLTVHAHRLYVLNHQETQVFSKSFQFAMENSPSFQVTIWRHPATGLNGSTIPTRIYQIESGQLCRDYMATVRLDSIQQQAYGTACRQANGIWKIASENQIRAFASLHSQTGAVTTPGQGCGMVKPHTRGPANFTRSLPRFSDPELARIHQFLYQSPAGSTYHNWKVEKQPGMKQRTAPHRQEKQPAEKPEKFHHNPSKLIKLVDYHPGY